MGALPKRKISIGRRNRRRSQDRVAVPTLGVCPKCNKVKRQHFACTYCGFYGKKETVATKATNKKE